MGRPANRILTAAALVIAACGAPDAPPIEGPQVPTAAADVLCVDPGFPRDVGQARYRFVDMDQGESCEVYVEQDTCVLAIFDDCTDRSSDPREWQGRALPSREIAVAPRYPLDASGVSLPRSPACCVGPVFPVEGATAWALLDCRLEPCASVNRRHTGLYMTRDVDPTPAWAVDRVESVAPATTAGPSVAAVWDDVRQAAWLGWTNGGLYLRTAEGQVETVDAALPAGFLAQDADAVYAAGSDRLARIDKVSGTVGPARTLSGPVLAMVRIAEGLLVAVDEGASSRLLLYPNGVLFESISAEHSGRVTGLTTRPADGIAVATFDDPPRLVVLGATLTAVRSVFMSDLDALGVAEVVPAQPRLLSPDRLAFVGACFAGAGKIHCYYEHSLTDATARPERLGLPAEARLTDLVIAGDDIWLGGASGAVHRVRRRPLQPRPSDVTEVEHDVAALVSTPGALWALSTSGRLSVLKPAP